MSVRHVWIALAATVGALGLVSCETDNVAPASVDTASAKPAPQPVQGPEANSQGDHRSNNDYGPGAPLEAPPVP